MLPLPHLIIYVPILLCCHVGHAAQTDANLSAHLHRLPTPPPYLRRMRLSHGRGRRYRVLDEAVASQGRRRRMANAAAGCSWRSSCKSPRTLPKCKCLITKQLTFIAVRGDLQEGHVYDKRLCGYASRCQFPLFPVPIPLLPSTKTPFLCFFGLQNPHFQAFQAQN